jgi:hypothetical protein
MRRGEKIFQRIWNAISGGPLYKNILFIITYDEHGGCYDHVAPPGTAIPPDNSPPQYADIKINPFKQYGPRVPAVVVSPYIRPGTVFRSDKPGVEYDHTSILATLRDWIFRSGVTPTGASAGWLDSKRIDNAPTLWQLLTLEQPRTEIPAIPGGKLGVPIALPMPARACADLGNPAALNALSKSQIVEAEALRRFQEQCGPTISDMTGEADDYNKKYAQIQQEVCDECNKDMSKCHDALCCLPNDALGSEVIQELQYGEPLVLHSENHKPLRARAETSSTS